MSATFKTGTIVCCRACDGVQIYTEKDNQCQWCGTEFIAGVTSFVVEEKLVHDLEKPKQDSKNLNESKSLNGSKKMEVCSQCYCGNSECYGQSKARRCQNCKQGWDRIYINQSNYNQGIFKVRKQLNVCCSCFYKDNMFCDITERIICRNWSCRKQWSPMIINFSEYNSGRFKVINLKN